MANLETKESGIPFGDIPLKLAAEWNVLPHQHYLPQYTSFIRAISSPFVAASTYHLSEYLHRGKVLKKLFGRDDPEGIRTITRNFRRIRIDFIRRISQTTLLREQVFANAMKDSNIYELQSARLPPDAVDDYDKCSRAYTANHAEQQQRAAVGITFKWRPFLRHAVRCMRCFFVHRFAEAPLPDGQSACPWLAQFIPGNCAESLAMAMLEGYLDRK